MSLVLLFGDSWARQSWYHDSTPTEYYYPHWSLSNTYVNNNINDWFNQYISNTCINFAEYGNTNSLIIQQLYNRTATISNIQQDINYIIFQTDPLRIFAPRQDYTDKLLVWKNFQVWAQQNNFNWHNSSLNDLLDVIFKNFYQALIFFQKTAQQKFSDRSVKLYIIGGVSALHKCIADYPLNIIHNSISNFLGLDQDSVFENRSSLINFTHVWQDNISSTHKNILLDQWQEFENQLIKKENFWINNPELFAGRHLTTKGITTVANLINNTI